MFPSSAEPYRLISRLLRLQSVEQLERKWVRRKNYLQGRMQALQEVSGADSCLLRKLCSICDSDCVYDTGRAANGQTGNFGGPGVTIGLGVDDIAEEERGEGTKYLTDKLLWG